MADIFREHRGGFWTAERKRSLYLGLLLILIALFVQLTAGRYSFHQSIAASPVGDIFLDNLPLVNLDFLIVGGSLIVFWIIPLIYFIPRPKYLLFTIKAIALFVITRAFFISLTHVGLYPVSIFPSSANTGFGFYHLMTYQGNFFFSGHTGFPFLMALILWEKRFWKWFFLGASVVFGAAVLLAHVHYSIDVFAAPFIVYGVFSISKKLFPQDYALFSHNGV